MQKKLLSGLKVLVEHCSRDFVDKVSYSREYRGGSCEKLPEASPCSTEPVPAGSRTEPKLGQSEIITCDNRF